MKEIYELSVQLPFDDYAILEWEMTEEEYDAFLEFCGDNDIWDEPQYEEMLSAAASAAANYLVGYHCESDPNDRFHHAPSFTLDTLMKHLGEDEESIADFWDGDGQYRREILAELLFENQAFYMDEG